MSRRGGSAIARGRRALTSPPRSQPRAAHAARPRRQSGARQLERDQPSVSGGRGLGGRGKEGRERARVAPLFSVAHTSFFPQLYARRAHFFPPARVTAYYDAVTATVRAEAQAAALETLLAGPLLTPEETDVVRWGRNAKVTVPKRFGAAAGGPHADVYRAATALEALVGYLYLTAPPRLHTVMRYLGLGGPDDAAGEAVESGQGGG